QLSATSQIPAADRQTSVLFASAGQSTLDPVQLSAGSQTPPEGRHSVPAGTSASAGQSLLTPSQDSATSQTPAEDRHSVPALPAGCWQVSSTPSQVSVVQTLPSSVHAVPAATLPSAGQSAPLPV